MITYHKIDTVYKRDPENKMKTLLEGEFSTPAFEYLRHNEWVFTEKVDGTNIRVMWDGKTITFNGKTDNAQLPMHLIQALQNMFDTTPMRRKFADKFGVEGEVCLYGEGYGPKIQGGGKYREDHSFVLFDILIGKWWLQREDVVDISDFFDIDIVPVIGSGDISDMVVRTRNGFKSQWGDFTAEGIVARPSTELIDRNGRRIITKIKYKDF